MPSNRHEIFHCRGCGRTADSPQELLAQGCEGTHARYVLAPAQEVGEVPVRLTREQTELLLKITGPRVATDPANQYGDWSADLDARLRGALDTEGGE